MSVSNDGISRFESSVVYAPVTFADGLTSGTIVSNTIDAEAVKLTLNSNVGLFVSGGLSDQDLTPAGEVVYLNPLPFMCNIVLGALSGAVTLPPVYAGARIVISNTSGGNRVITAFAGDSIVCPQTAVASAFFTMETRDSLILCRTDGATWMALLLPGI